MTVKELIKELKSCDQEKEIFVSSDEEGNGFNGIYEVCISNGEEMSDGTEIKGYIIYPM